MYTKLDCLVKARKLAMRFGGYAIDYYYKLLKKYNFNF
jgi:hypothetical protein